MTERERCSCSHSRRQRVQVRKRTVYPPLRAHNARAAGGWLRPHLCGDLYGCVASGVRRPTCDKLMFAGGCCFRTGLEDPCKYTPDGFERPRSPCGENGICTVASSWNELAPHQRNFDCNCVGNYIGDRCERCDHGYTFKSGCEGAVPAAAATSLATA